MTYIEKEPLLEKVKAMQDDSAFGVPRIIAAIENAPASEVARKIFEEIEEVRTQYIHGKIDENQLIIRLYQIKKKFTEDGE